MKIETQNRFSSAMKSVFDEIERQDEKFGKDRDNHPLVWGSILTEEVGEMSAEINDANFQTENLTENYRAEWAQIVAVGLQAIRHFDRFKNGEIQMKGQ